MTIASEFQELFNFLRDTATDKALQQDVPLAGTALQAVPAALFSTLQQQIATALTSVGDDASAIAAAINGLSGDLVTASVNGDIVTITIDTSDTPRSAPSMSASTSASATSTSASKGTRASPRRSALP